jgi:uncharacterized GH25 family protein
MNQRVLLAVLAIALATALGLYFAFLAPQPAGPQSLAAGTRASEAAGRTSDGVDLAAADEAGVLEIDPATGEPVRRREVRAQAPRGAKAAAEVPTGPAMKGRVVDEAGRGVPKAKVEMRVPLRDQGLVGLLVEDVLTRQETETDGLGYFELIGLPGKTVEFDVGADGYARLEAFEIDLPTDFTFPIQDLRLASGVVLHGTVVDLSGRAIAGAELYLVDPERPDFAFRAMTHPEPDAVSDDEGRFELARVAVGAWAVEVRATERPQRTFRGETNEVGRLRHALWFEIPDGGVVRGVVRGLDAARYPAFRVEANPTEGTPFFGGRSFERPRAELDGDGRFEIRGLDRELEYRIKLAPAQNGLVAFAGVTGTRSQEITVRPLDVEVELDYAPGATITFQVLDATTREPVEYFSAKFGQQFNTRTLTHANGEEKLEHTDGVAAFVDVYRGDAPAWSDEGWRLEINAPGYEDYARESVEFQDGVVLELGEILLMPAGQLRVVVKDAVDGDPIHSAIVTLTKLAERDGEERAMWRGMDVLTPPVRKTKTDSDGRAKLSGFGSEPAELVVSRSRYADHVQRVVLGGDDQTLEILLSAESEVEVLARDVNGNELGDVRIEHKAPGDEGVTATISASNRGRARFRGLVPGEHRFRLAARGDAPEAPWESVSLAPGSETTLILLGPPRGLVRGTVLSAGRPVANAEVTVRRSDGNDEQRFQRQGRRGGRMTTGRSATTDSAGRFEIAALDYGDYAVEVESDEREMSETTALTLDRATVELEIVLSSCSVSGIVVDADGRPIPGVEVTAFVEGEVSQERAFESFASMGDPSVVEVASFSDVPGKRTSSSGAFELVGLRAGTPIVLEARHRDATTTRSAAFVLSVDERRDGLRLVMQPAGSVDVSIAAADGERMGFYQVVARGPEGAPVRTRVLSSGNSTSITSLEPGRWTIELSKMGRQGALTALESRTVEIEARRTTELEFTPKE